MSRRIDIELTSKRDDGTWTWRAAGAREPKGVVSDALVPTGTNVNDVVRADVETDLDGSRVLSITPPKQKTARTGLLELIVSDKPFEAVTSQLRKKEARGPRGDKRGPRKPRGDGDTRERSERPRRPRFETPPEIPQRPRPKRLKPGRTNVDAVLKDLPEAQRTIAERVLQGGIPAVRTAVAEQNAAAVKAGQEKIPVEGLVTIAEGLLPRLRVAEWLDKAVAAQKIIDDIDLRDLRSVVVASDDPVVARDESTRSLATEMKSALVRRQEQETQNWFEDIRTATQVGRVVRALKLSSQPPKAGVPFPADLAAQLAQASTAALTPDAPAERWVALLEAIAFSPVRSSVKPAAPATQVTDDLTKTVTRLAPLVPQISALYGVAPTPGAPAPRPLRPARATAKPARKKASEVNADAQAKEAVSEVAANRN